MAKTNYRYEARRIDGFLAQFIRYVASGHYFYLTGRIPVARVRRTRETLESLRTAGPGDLRSFFRCGKRFFGVCVPLAGDRR